MGDAARDQDRADVRLVLAGDVEAFEGIVRRWQRPLVNLAYRYCRHPGQAEELAQDVFLRVFRSLHQWRGDAAFSTWLFAVAANVCRTHVRRARGVEVPFQDFRDAVDRPDHTEEAATAEVEHAVRRTVNTLPRKYRDAVVLFYFMEQDVAQAARWPRRAGRHAEGPAAPGPRAPQEPPVGYPWEGSHMTLRNLDQALASEQAIEPSARFPDRVMAAVRREAFRRDAAAIWESLWPILAGASAFVPVAVALNSMAIAVPGSWRDDPMARPGSRGHARGCLGLHLPGSGLTARRRPRRRAVPRAPRPGPPRREASALRA